MSSPYKTFSYYTFGCKVNFADSSYIADQLIGFGMSQVPFDNYADFCFINTCSVTENADRKARKIIKKINEKFPETKIVVLGCFAQLKPTEISKIKGVHNVVGAHDKFNISKILSDNNDKNKISDFNIDNVEKFNITYSTNQRTRAFLKIQDGCNYNCSYCTIPLARGKHRNATIKYTLDIINKLLNEGFQELVLSGINIGDFGFNNDESLDILLMELEKIKKLKRYRISSIEPNLISENILQIMSKSKKAMPHFHIPLQSGSNKILKLMKRRYTREQYIDIIKDINKFIPNVNIGVDVIVGFPTETNEDYIDTYNLLSELDVSYFHIFTYSERNNTEAKNIFPKVDVNIKKSRRKLLMQLSEEKKTNYINKNINRKSKILFESYNNGYLSGLTENYIRVHAKGDEEMLNKIKNIKIINNSDLVTGVLVE